MLAALQPHDDDAAEGTNPVADATQIGQDDETNIVFPITRRRKTGKQHVPLVEAAQSLRSRRYDMGFWGEAGGRRKAGRRTAKQKAEQLRIDMDEATEQTRLDNMRDLDRCRSLLTSMSDEALRSLLMRSRFNFGGTAGEIVKRMDANRTLDDRWLEEAAKAFHADVHMPGPRRATIYRKQADVVEDVIANVQRSRRVVPGSAAERDESRICQLREAMASEAGKCAAATNCYISVKLVRPRCS